MENTACILRIEKISPNDGHGLRTVVFFKGCPLRCAWCSTPESQRLQPELCYKAARCVHCGRCVQACPQGALTLDKHHRLHFDRKSCTDCGRCADICPQDALSFYGKAMTLDAVMKEIRKDEIFYHHSGGGVTLSGGDVLLQADFAAALLKACQDNAIHTMAELDMYGDFSRIAQLLPHLDALYADLKLMNPTAHKRWTGVDNTSILDNIRRAAEQHPALHIRVPLIPGVNDDAENLLATLDFCQSLAACAELEFLPYHRLGTATYAALFRDFALAELSAMSRETALQKLAVLADQKADFPIRLSGEQIY